LQPAKKITGIAQVYFGWAHIIKRSAWKVVGPFREEFKYGWEESDFSLRLWNKGYKVVSSDSLSVIHDASGPGKKFSHRHFLNLRNSVLSILLNYPTRLLPSWLKGTLLNLNPLQGSAEPAILFRMRIIFSVLFFLPYLLRNRKPVSIEAIELYYNKKHNPTQKQVCLQP
jgi:GT2 family glycosyltransferase